MHTSRPTAGCTRRTTQATSAAPSHRANAFSRAWMGKCPRRTGQQAVVGAAPNRIFYR